MSVPEYFTQRPVAAYHHQRDPKAADSSVDEFLTQRTRVLTTKMVVFATEIQERLGIRKTNIEKLFHDQLSVSARLSCVEDSRLDPADKLQQAGFLEQKQIELNREERAQDTECWRDVAHLMRDFLAAWEGYEQARARGQFMNTPNPQQQPVIQAKKGGYPDQRG